MKEFLEKIDVRKIMKVISLSRSHKVLINGIKICINIILYGAEDSAKEFVLKCDHQSQYNEDLEESKYEDEEQFELEYEQYLKDT